MQQGANEWNVGEMTVKLPSLSEGEALEIWLELEESEQENWLRCGKGLIGVLDPTRLVLTDSMWNMSVSNVWEGNWACYSFKTSITVVGNVNPPVSVGNRDSE